MRQTFKDGMGRVFQRPKTHTEYTLMGYPKPIIVSNATHKIVAAPAMLGELIGIEVYAAKGWLTNVATTKKLYPYDRSRKLDYVNGSVT